MKSRTFLLVAMLTITGCGTRTTPTHPQPRQSLRACLAGVGKVSHSYHALDIKNRYGLLVAEISTFPTPAKAAAFAAQLRVSGEAVGRHVVLWDGEPYGLDSEGRDAVKSCLGAQQQVAAHALQPQDRISHAAASAFHFALKMSRPAYGVVAHVLVRNWKSPDAVELGFFANGLSRDSLQAMFSIVWNGTCLWIAARWIQDRTIPR